MPAIAYKKTDTTDTAWDAGAQEKKLKADDKAAYRLMYAWVDPEGDETTKSAYKFPHHMVSGEGEPGAANMKACSAIIGALNGGRGGTKIPEADRQGVYNHAKKHLVDGGEKDVPELKSLAQIEREERELDARMSRAALEFRDKVGKVERRIVSSLELRARRDAGGSDDDMVIAGHASVFDTPADLGWFVETVKPGAFKRTIVDDDVRALFNHDPNFVLGRKSPDGGAVGDTLRLSEDSRGLYFEVDPPDTQWAIDLSKSIRRRDITQCSIGFYARSVDIRIVNGVYHRDLTDVQLFDVSPVTFPAFDSTDVSVRTAQEIAKDFPARPGNTQPGPEEWEFQSEARRRLLQLAG